MRLFTFITALCLFSCPSISVYATKPDSLHTSAGRKNQQNVLLNASSTTKPRIISLGIPDWGAHVMEDGLPASLYRDFFPGHWSWRSGLGTKDMELTRLDESAILLGATGFYPKSISKTGAERLEGEALYSVDQHGRNEVEMNVAAPLPKGWGFNINLFQDFNPGSNHLDYAQFQSRIQYYKAAISKNFDSCRGLFHATYSYMNTLDLSDPNGPFIFKGDGSVQPYEDFKLGTDQYLPANSTFDYIDLPTGKRCTKRYTEDLGIPVHVLTAILKYDFDNRMSLDVSSRLRLAKGKLKETTLGGITTVNSNDGYTYEDGTPFIGKLQNRFMLYYDAYSTEWMTTATLSGQMGSHRLKTGINVWLGWSGNAMATTNFAHEARKNPKVLLYNNELYYLHNTSAQYYDGSQSRTALFAQDEWKVSSRLELHAGIRAEYSGMGGDAAYNFEGTDNNTRGNGWSLASPGVTLRHFHRDMLNGAASLVGYYQLNRRWGLELDAIATLKHAELWQYGEAELPSCKAQPNYIVRGGFNFKNDRIDLQSLLTYMRQGNNYTTNMWTHELESAAGGYPAGYQETVFVGSTYDMQVLGWTTDMILTPFRGFSFHGLFTFRLPKYMNYEFQPCFSDGYSELYDFSGNFITQSSNVEIELEPSYEWDKWRFWVSARYYSKQYINITNTLYLKPRWETFAGIDFSWNKHVSFSANVINFLNQTGASAGIQEASLATDVTPYCNYLTSGSYLLPLTAQFSIRLKL